MTIAADDVDTRPSILTFVSDPVRFVAHRPGLVRASAEADLATRAFELADRCMTEQLVCHCVRLSSDALIPCDERGDVTMKVSSAAPAVVEAFEWLRDRGLARIEAQRAASSPEQIRLLLPADGNAEREIATTSNNDT